MEANSIGQSGGADTLEQPPEAEEERSEEELALYKAAMMEELGNGRVDTLPLADRGGDRVQVRMPIQNQVEDDPNDPTARWRNIQFDDVTPADAERDPMYDGQLYRLRKQAIADKSNQKGPSGRGRGGGANRGGNSGRGGSSRGGHGSGTERRSDLLNPSGRTPKPSFKARRVGTNRHARFVTPHRAEAAVAQAAASKKESHALITQQRRRLAATVGPSRNPQPQTAAPMLAIAGQGVTHNTPANASRSQNLQKDPVGLAASRWATPGAVDVGIPLAQANPPPTGPKAKNRGTKHGMTLNREHVKISKDDRVPIRGIARLLKKDSPNDTYFTIELQVDGKTILREKILDIDMFSLEGTTITYRPQRYDDESTPLPSNTWRLDFHIPSQAGSFFQPVANVRNSNRALNVNVLAQPNTGFSAAAPSKQMMPIEKPTATQVAGERVSSLLACDLRSTAASAGSPPMSMSDFSESSDEFVGPSGFPGRPASFEWPLAQPVTDRISVDLSDKYQSGGDQKISAQAWSQKGKAAVVEPLSSFGHDDSEPFTSSLQDLLNTDDTELIQSTFDHFENSPDGPFLVQLSTIVAKENVSPASRLTGKEVLSSVKYQEAAESLVGGYLCQSKTFSKMSDIFAAHYMRDKTRKVLAKAVAHRESQNMTQHDVAPHAFSAFNPSESGPSILQYRVEPVPLQDSKLPKVANNAENLKGSASRLSLEQSTSEFNNDLISWDSVDCVLPQQAEVEPINPANTLQPQQVQLWPISQVNPIGTNDGGIPTEAGQEELSRQSDSTKAKTEPVMTPPKPTNSSQTQETDMALWDAILNAPKNTKQDPSRIRAFSNSKQQSVLATTKGVGDVSTNSDCNRLASTLEGLALNNDLAPEPSTLKVQPSPVSDTSIDAGQLPSLDRSPSNSSQAMFQKIKESLKAPLELSSRSNSTLSKTPVPSVSSIAKSDTGSIPPTQHLAAVDAALTRDLNVENPANVQPLRKGVTAIRPPYPDRYSHPEPPVNFLRPRVYLPTGHPQRPPAYSPSAPPQYSLRPSPSSSTAEVQPKIVVRSESKGTQTSDPISTQITNLETITNKDIGVFQGLQASRWASEPVDHAPAPRAHPTRFTPITPQTHGNASSSLSPFDNPMAPMMSTPRKQENVPYSQQPPPIPRFRTQHAHKRNDSIAFSPGSSPFTATRGRGPSAISPEGRTALSPVRQGENVQAKLQSRPNTFLTGRPPNANE